MSSKKNSLGKEVPLCRSHVIAWFIQMDFTEKTADEFFGFYDKIVGGIKWEMLLRIGK